MLESAGYLHRGGRAPDGHDQRLLRTGAQYGTVLAFGVPDHPVYAMEYETFFRKNAILMATVTPDWAEYLAKARDFSWRTARNCPACHASAADPRCGKSVSTCTSGTKMES